jgi:alpha-2-macroglobulin-like protein
VLYRYTLPLSVVLALSSGLALAHLPSAHLPTTESAPAPADAALETAPTDTVRLRPSAAARTRVRDLEAWLAANPTTRGHVATDRPLYRPGDTVQAKLWSVSTRGMSAAGAATIAVELVDPRGTVAQRQSVVLEGGGADASFALDKAAPGGSWTLRATLQNGQVVEGSLVVNTFEAPRIKKTLDFAREGYGPGDTVEAAVTLVRATGETLANTEVVANVRVGQEHLAPIRMQTDAHGEGIVRFELPAELRDPDALLTVLVDDAGVTESISRAIPIALDDVRVGVYPEGGDLVEGLESRVYFEAADAFGKPVDIKGVVVDDRGEVVTRIASDRDGRGRFVLRPEEGRTYRVRVEDRAGTGDFTLPSAARAGCGCCPRARCQPEWRWSPERRG